MTSKDIYSELNAFMGRMRDGETREMVENLQTAIEYQAEKLRIYEEKYKEATGKERPELNDSDRKRLAGKARTLNTHLLQLTETTWSPDTLMDWYHKLIAEKYDSTGPGQKKRGRRVLDDETIALVVKIGKDNPNWGYLRIANYIKYLGHKISFMTIKRILTDHSIYPHEDGRKNSDWSKFFDAHKDVLAACDFATYELLTPNGLVRESILFFENITTREVWLGGIACDPDANWSAQVARNQTDAFDGKLNGMKYIIHDRDPLFLGKFTDILKSAGCKTKLIPPRMPEYNGYIESFIKTIKTECLNRLILTSEPQLRYVVKEFLEYYNHERPHSGLDGKMIIPLPQDDDGEVTEFSRLGGLLKSYRRVKRAA